MLYVYIFYDNLRLQLKKYYSFITFGLLINVVVLLLNCLVLILCLYIHIYSLTCCFLLHLSITDTFYSKSRKNFILFHLFYVSRCSVLYPQAVQYGHASLLLFSKFMPQLRSIVKFVSWMQSLVHISMP